ncbi:MAG TPA: (2Fe-2S) ferredoxin domain-containing protein [Mariprofundaceae bacterium]|nr:(2Fe-2S) ferredoxin domain-containing protein [Mariprofundaceae bacterium]
MTDIEVCTGPECGACGGPELLLQLQRLGIAAVAGHCRGLCHEAPVAEVNGELLAEASLGKLQAMLQ